MTRGLPASMATAARTSMEVSTRLKAHRVSMGRSVAMPCNIVTARAHASVISMSEIATATQKSHDFRGSNHARNARRVRIVLLFSFAMMVGEIAAGQIFGSMALLADGWHMATHL